MPGIAGAYRPVGHLWWFRPCAHVPGLARTSSGLIDARGRRNGAPVPRTPVIVPGTGTFPAAPRAGFAPPGFGRPGAASPVSGARPTAGKPGIPASVRPGAPRIVGGAPRLMVGGPGTTAAAGGRRLMAARVDRSALVGRQQLRRTPTRTAPTAARRPTATTRPSTSIAPAAGGGTTTAASLLGPCPPFNEAVWSLPRPMGGFPEHLKGVFRLSDSGNAWYPNNVEAARAYHDWWCSTREDRLRNECARYRSAGIPNRRCQELGLGGLLAGLGQDDGGTDWRRILVYGGLALVAGLALSGIVRGRRPTKQITIG